ncbi:MAG: fused MFS/spermidine synthase [Candidatus Eisenbacteria bacterium]|nr:fused MFS/spermidine synthase [Candidatus Eisenbacteria bacterium]
MKRKGRLYFIFFLSGVAGLLYQVVWNRLLLLVFGGSSYATATVLASFMSGLALGSWLFGRRADRSPDPLRLYGAIEIGIAVTALLVPALTLAGRALFLRAAPALEGTALFVPVRYALAFLTLLLPTTLMGGTFPVLSRVIVRELDRVGRGVGLLYFLNTGGAVLGAVLAAFATLPFLGLHGSIAVGVAINVFVGFGALLLARGERRGAPARIAEEPAALEEGREVSLPDAPPHRAILFLFALSGFASLGYEVTWVRVLVFFLGNNTIFAFAIMLATFLTGLALGGALYGLLPPKRGGRLLFFGALEIGIALAALLTLRLFGEVNPMTHRLVRAFGLQSWHGLLVLRLAAAAMTMALPTLLIGATFPAVAHLVTASARRVGREVGGAYAVNTLGAIAGSLAAGFVLVPLLGVEKTLVVLSSINLAIGGVALLLARGRVRRTAGGAALAGAAALAILGGGRILPPIYGAAAPGYELVYADEGPTATVTVHEDRVRKTKLLCVNGIWEVPTDFPSLQVFRLLGNIGPLVHPEPRRALTVALGGGIALGSLALHDFDAITCVEICPEVEGGAKLFAEENHRVLENPRVRVLFNDGRNRLLLSDERYDVIVSDATHPGSADSWVLYTEDFYRLVLSRLGPEGLFCQWLPYHGVDRATYRTILRTFAGAFPEAALFSVARHSVLVGSPAPIRLDLERIKERIEGNEPVRRDLASVDLDDPVRIAAAVGLDREGMLRAAGPGPVNTDAHPRNSYAEARGHDRMTTVESMEIARSHSPDPAAYCLRPEAVGLDAGALAERVARIRLAWTWDGEAIRAHKEKRGGEAEIAWEEALRVDPENRGVARIYGEHLVQRAATSATHGNAAAVVPILEKLVRVVPWEADSHFRLANNLFREGRLAEAALAYREGLRIDPSNERAERALAACLDRIGGGAKAP